MSTRRFPALLAIAVAGLVAASAAADARSRHCAWYGRNPIYACDETTGSTAQRIYQAEKRDRNKPPKMLVPIINRNSGAFGSR